MVAFSAPYMFTWIVLMMAVNVMTIMKAVNG